jgi:hypothetical protein
MAAVVRDTASEGRARGLACQPIPVGLVRRLFSILDSAFVSRVGSATTLIRIVGLGFVLLVLVGLVAASVVSVAGWIPIVCFAIWAALRRGRSGAGSRRFPSSAATPREERACGENGCDSPDH